MKRQFTTANGGTINLSDETMKHLEAHPETGSLLEEAIAKITLPKSTFLLEEVIFDHIIGQSSCIEINPSAPAMFAVRKGRDLPTRTTIGMPKADTKSFVVIAAKKGSEWTLITGYAGSKAPREPHDRFFADPANRTEFEKALAFWDTHALVYEPEVMGTLFESTWKYELTKMGHPVMAA